MNNVIGKKLALAGLAGVLLMAAACFFGAYFAAKNLDPYIINLSFSAKGDDFSSIDLINEQAINGRIVSKSEESLMIETTVPANPFIEWEKEIEVYINDNTLISSGEIALMTQEEMAGEWELFLESDGAYTPLNVESLKEDPIAFEDLEINRGVLVVIDPLAGNDNLVAKRIIMGKER